MKDLELVKGIVEDFERTTQVTGGQNRTSTTHLSIFKIGSNRIILKTSVPSLISNGDEVFVAGLYDNGQFTALACNNLTANWISPLRQQGCGSCLLIFMAFISFVVSMIFLSFLGFFVFIIPITFSVFCVFVAIQVKKVDRVNKQAYKLVQIT